MDFSILWGPYHFHIIYCQKEVLHSYVLSCHPHPNFVATFPSQNMFVCHNSVPKKCLSVKILSQYFSVHHEICQTMCLSVPSPSINFIPKHVCSSLLTQFLPNSFSSVTKAIKLNKRLTYSLRGMVLESSPLQKQDLELIVPWELQSFEEKTIKKNF